MPCSSLEDFIHLRVSTPHTGTQAAQAANAQMVQLQAQAALQAAQQVSGILEPNPPHVLREGKPWPVLPPAQEAFQTKSWQQKETRQQKLVAEVRDHVYDSRMYAIQHAQIAADQIRTGTAAHRTPIQSLPVIMMSNHQAHILYDHLTLASVRQPCSLDTSLFGKLVIRTDSAPQRRSRRLAPKHNIHRSMNSEVQSQENLSIVARIHSANTNEELEDSSMAIGGYSPRAGSPVIPTGSGVHHRAETKRKVTGSLRPKMVAKRRRVRFGSSNRQK
ncbi:hypothetical protein TWF281_002971 [Arthrobotrys megalospora]